MRYRGNPWLLVLSLIFFVLMLSLAWWQLMRGFEKKDRQRQLHQDGAVIREGDLTALLERRESRLWFQPLELQGKWTEYSFLLDNSLYKEMIMDRPSPYCFLFSSCGQLTGRTLPGFRVFTLFAPRDTHWLVLVERGWLVGDRHSRPELPPLSRTSVTISALLIPNAGARWTLKRDRISGTDKAQIVQSIIPARLEGALNENIYPHPIFLSARSDGALPEAAPLAGFSFLSPQRHWAYAFQWLLMALTLSLLWFFASFKIRIRAPRA